MSGEEEIQSDIFEMHSERVSISGDRYLIYYRFTESAQTEDQAKETEVNNNV